MGEVIPAQAMPEEQALLGAVLSGYRDVPKLSRIVSPADFYRPGHEQIWTAMLAIHARGQHPEPLAVGAELGAQFQRVGGPVYLAECQEAASVAGNAVWYAERVYEMSVKRQIADMGRRFIQAQEDPDATASDLLAEVRGHLDSLTADRATGAVSSWQAFEQVIDTIEHGEPAAMPTPWPELTRLLGGLYPGQLIIIGARPSIGKSLAIENICTDVARRGKRVLFVTLEMSAKEIMQRTTAHTARVPLSSIREGFPRLSTVEMDAITRVSSELMNLPIEYEENPHMPVERIRAAAWSVRQNARRQGQELGLVAIDYVQLVPTRDSKATRQQQLGEVSRALKRLAKELQVPVVTAAQVNRAAAERPPMMSDLREAGDFEADADVVGLLHEPRVDDGGGRTIPTGDLEFIVAKSRNGPTGTITLQKFGHFARLADVA